MDDLVLAFGPVFAAGFAIQKLLEILDPAIKRLTGSDADTKKLVLGLLSLVAGLVVAFAAGLRVLQPLGITDADLVDAMVTGLVISAGTEGINSIMKFLGYAKEDKKGEAAVSKKTATEEGALPLVE